MSRRFTGFTLLEVRIGTGRYFLHAHRIEFQQPTTGEPIVVVSPLAPELEAWLGKLQGSPG